ncbi:MAG: porin family protein [Betaproteobacteria bacterium]|nr:MAG: porin family protein [Betaproteobacteria bacterium]TMG77150.1 MAG: porin family protein [Betaproteobacteria bacterium]
MDVLKIIRIVIGAFLAIGLSSVASAQRFDTKNLFFGGGLSQNKLEGSKSGTGYQFFGGYAFGQVAPQIRVDAELGYMDSGNVEKCQTFPILGSVCGSGKAKGLWANGVARYRVAPQIDLIGRAGLDFGDDDGFMFGVGGGYLLNRNSQLRLEYVVRQNINSLQFNFVYQP